MLEEYIEYLLIEYQRGPMGRELYSTMDTKELAEAIAQQVMDKYEPQIDRMVDDALDYLY